MTSVKPYTWNRNRPDEQPGARIRNRDTGGYVFVPMGDMIHVSNALIDILESNQNNQEN